MALSATRVTVGIGQVEIAAGPGRFEILNKGTAVVFLGAPGVTTGTGWELAVSGRLTVELEAGDEINAIAGTAGHVVHVLRSSA